MGYSVGYDPNWGRDVGYGVPAECDHPECSEQIDRGLYYVCGSDVFGGEYGCGLYFCEDHLPWSAPVGTDADGDFMRLCDQCEQGDVPFTPKEDILEWVVHKLTDPSWEQWRQQQDLGGGYLEIQVLVPDTNGEVTE